MSRFKCPGCGNEIQIEADDIGRFVRCVHCHAVHRMEGEESGVTPDSPRPAPQREVNDELSLIKELSGRKRSVNGTVVGTDVGLLTSLVVAAPVTAAFYFGAQFIPVARIQELFPRDGIVAFSVMFLTFWTSSMLFFKYGKLRKQRRALLYDLLPAELGRKIAPESVKTFKRHIGNLRKSDQRSFFVNRVLNALNHFESRRSAEEVAVHLNNRAEADAQSVESSYTIIRVFIWAIPILGFIGTVLGIGIAVGGFSETVQGTPSMEEIQDSLSLVTTGLAVAFNTTLLALVMSLLVMFPASSLQKTEEGLLVRIEDYCEEQLSRRLAGEGRGSANVVEAISNELDGHRKELDGWTGKLEMIGEGIVARVVEGWDQIHAKILARDETLLRHAESRLDKSAATGENMLHAITDIQKCQSETAGKMINSFEACGERFREGLAKTHDEMLAGFRDRLKDVVFEMNEVRECQSAEHRAESESLLASVRTLAGAIEKIELQVEKVTRLQLDRMGEMAGSFGETLRTTHEEIVEARIETARQGEEQIASVRNAATELGASFEQSLKRSLASQKEALASAGTGQIEALAAATRKLTGDYRDVHSKIVDQIDAVTGLNGQHKTLVTLQKTLMANLKLVAESKPALNIFKRLNANLGALTKVVTGLDENIANIEDAALGRRRQGLFSRLVSRGSNGTGKGNNHG